MNIIRPLNNRCHMGRQWVIPVVCLHMLYVLALIGITCAVRNIEFRFDEFRKLLLGIITSGVSVGSILNLFFSDLFV